MEHPTDKNSEGLNMEKPKNAQCSQKHQFILPRSEQPLNGLEIPSFHEMEALDGVWNTVAGEMNVTPQEDG